MSTMTQTPSANVAPKAIPGPSGLLAVPRLIRRNVLDALTELVSSYGNVVGFRLGPTRCVLLSRPEHFEHVLGSGRHDFDKSHRSNRVNRWALGEGLLTSDGELWHRQRKALNPAFQRRRLNAMTDSIVRESLQMLERWGVAGGELELDVAREMAVLALQITCRALLGLEQPQTSNGFAQDFGVLHAELWKKLSAPVPIPPWVPTASNRRFTEAKRATYDTVERIIQDRLANPTTGEDALSILLSPSDDNTRMSDQQLRDELMILLTAGHETTANLLTFAWYALSSNPDVRRRWEDELTSRLAGRQPELADLAGLAYTRAIVEETLRLYPPVYAISRSCIRDVVIDGYTIPRGTYVMLGVYPMHRDPTLWDRPLSFEPERFLPGAREIPTFQYVPFGAGPRRCIGDQMALMEATLVLATVGQRVRIDGCPGFEPVPEGRLTMRVRDGFRARARLREDATQTRETGSASP